MPSSHQSPNCYHPWSALDAQSCGVVHEADPTGRCFTFGELRARPAPTASYIFNLVLAKAPRPILVQEGWLETVFGKYFPSRAIKD